MQELRKIGEDETLANSLDPMNKNWKSLQSQNSGVTFPIKDIVVGQACFSNFGYSITNFLSCITILSIEFFSDSYDDFLI